MKVLVALDESRESARAARVAVRLFGTIPGAEFLVINVAAAPATWVGSAAFGTVAPLDVDPEWLRPSDVDQADHERVLIDRANAAGVPHPEPVTRSGDPVIEICAAADEYGVDVIVVGSHDKTALRRLFDPSVAAGVVRATPLPVLVVSGTPTTDTVTVAD